MFKRLRQLRISLAAKCQLLFGAAVVLIISAALFVPWNRMEQLTEQLNERVAGALADNAVAEHIAAYAAAAPSGSGPLAPATTRPAQTRPSTMESADAVAPPPTPPRIVSLIPPRDVSDAAKFDRRALAHFTHHADSPSYSAYYDRDDGTKGYRYAKPLYLNKSCLACHSASADAAAPASAPAATVPATTAPAAWASVLSMEPVSRRVGIVTVDFGSRIDTTELLLNRAFLLAAGLLAGSLAIFTFYFITTRLILQPVRVLQETAEKVSQGDLNIRSDINTGDEFQQLSETFNVMLTNLKHNADQLRAVNKSLDLKLGQLAETNLGLYESNRLKSEFLANVSHELRTPLNSILGFADLLKDSLSSTGPAGAAADGKDLKSLRYVGNIRNSGRNLLELINDLLDLAKIEAGRMEIRSEPLSLNDLFEGLNTILKPLAEQKRVSIVTSVAADVPILHSDPGKLQQVLYNFLANAIKFSPPQGSIDLDAQLEGAQHVRIAVTDHGPGIEPDMHAVIFEKFRQIDGSVTRTHSGTGLGLAISKELTTLMGGSIGIQSTPGHGSTFWVILPLKVESGHVDMRGKLVLS